jgi:hypothetical protein
MNPAMPIKKNLDESQKEDILKFLSRFPQYGLTLFSSSYPLSEDMLNKFLTKWDWEAISTNKNIEWTIELIEKYQDKLDWGNSFEDLRMSLPYNEKLPWSIEFINQFIDKWDWICLSRNSVLPWSENLLESFMDKWDWYSLSGNNSLPFSFNFIEKYKDKWHWDSLSSLSSMPWSIELIREYKDKWHWDSLSSNTFLPWSIELIETFADKWTWGAIKSKDSETSPVRFETGSLSLNRGVIFTPEIIDKFSNRWDKFDLENNPSFNPHIETIQYLPVPFNSDYIENRLNENTLKKIKVGYEWKSGYNNGLLWTNDIRELMCRNINGSKLYPDWIISPDRFIWDDNNIEGAYNQYLRKLWNELSATNSLYWTSELIKKYEDKWNWKILSQNQTIPWSKKIIYQFYDKWDWSKLAYNKSISFKDMDLLYEFRKEFGSMAINTKAKSFNWTLKEIETWHNKEDIQEYEFPYVWMNLLQPYMTYNLDEIILQFTNDR